MEQFNIENNSEINKVKEREERINRMKERARVIDALPNEEIIDRATEMLSHLGLTFDDLVGKRVLDLGSGTQIIERAATIKRVGTVLSVDSRDYVLSKRIELKNGIVANIIKGIPQIPDSSIDLLISHAGPPGISAVSRMQGGVDYSVSEILRMLKAGGEARISSVFFDFIAQKQERYQALLKKIHKDNEKLSGDEKQEMVKIEMDIKNESFKYLRDKGINIVEKKNETTDHVFASYGIIKK